MRKIKEARYGKDVRSSIHDAILQCYEDGKAGAIDLEARQELEKIASPAQLGRIKIDGTTITIDENGVIHGAAQVPEGVLIGSGEVVEIELPPIVAHKAYVDSLDNNIAEQFSDLKDTTRQLNNTLTGLESLKDMVRFLSIENGKSVTLQSHGRPNFIIIRETNNNGGSITSVGTQGNETKTLVGTLSSSVTISGSGGSYTISNAVGWTIYPIVLG